MSLSLLTGVTFMSLDMEKPLNKAHSIEREAEQELKRGNFDEAEQKYTSAAEMMKIAMEEVSGTAMVAPLRAQLDKLHENKLVIAIKRKEAAEMKAISNKQPISPNLLSESPKKEPLSREADNEASIPKPAVGKPSTRNTKIEGGYPRNIASLNELASMPGTWHMVPKELIKMVSERETDSLLQFLYQPIEDESPLSSSSTRRKIPKSHEEIIEQYKTRLNLLQKTAEALIKALDDTERENKSLKSQVDELQYENAELHERLDVYDNSRYYHGMGSDDIEQHPSVPADMMASMLIDQPESYFEFNQKAMEAELRDAIRDVAPPKKSDENLNDRKSRNYRDSVQYQDLEVGVNEVTLIDDRRRSEQTEIHLESLAGLPPLSPIHFDIDVKDVT